MGVVPQGAAQSAQKKKAAAASSSSDSDSSDDEQPASKKPALVKASPSVSKAVSGVAVGGKKVVGKPASSSSDSDSSDEGNAVSAKKPVGVVGSGVKTGMGVVPQGAAQSAQKKKAAAASSSSDSDSSDDEQPASKKPALVKASPSVSKAVSGVAVGGKKVVGKPASSSSDSDSSDEGNAVSAKKPVGVVGSGVKTGMGVVPQGAAQSAQKKKAAAASSSSDSDSSDDEQPASKKPALVKASPSVSKAVSGVAVGGKKVVGKPASSSSDSDSSDEGNAVSAKKPVGVVGSGVKTGMGVVPQGAAQSAQKKKAAAASSSSDSDSSDDEQPASKKPALVKASPSVSKAVSGVAVGGKKVVGKPASSSSDSDSSDEGNAVSAKKPVGVVGSGVKTGMGVVPQGAAQSAQKKKAAAASSSSDSDSSDDEQPASKKPALVKASPSVSKAVSGVAVGGKKVMVSPLVTSSRLNGAFKVSKPCFNRKRRFSFVGSSGADVGNSVVSAVDDCSLGASRRSVPFSQLSVSSTPSNESSGPFRRVLENDVFVHPNLRDNSFEAKRNARGSWGEKANRDLKFTSGKVFKQEKTKKKRGSYSGGSLSLDSCSFKFNE
uniref:SRP40_C domain-containing protein n=2 Tax=Schistosoma mansoni TaxID=6183 RepID=A0A5K4EKH2_SCHMA